MKVYIMEADRYLDADPGSNLLEVLRKAGFGPEAPCGGNGTCGKCRVMVNGEEVLACCATVNEDICVSIPKQTNSEILTSGVQVTLTPDAVDEYVMAYDIGTTTVVAFLMDGKRGEVLAQASCVNPQTRYGADVISRIQFAMNGGSEEISRCIRGALSELMLQTCVEAGIEPKDIATIALVGNTAMHHLLLQIDPKPLTTPPYMPSVSHALEIPAGNLFPAAINATVRVLPNIAGFVGADTVGCLVATGFDQLEALTLMIDIGTNGEMVLGNKDGFLACSTAAGPAFEGAKIQCGMRGAEGAVDHVTLDGSTVSYSVIGNVPAKGLCGSGLLDLVAVLLQTEDIDESGRMEEKTYTLHGCDVFLSQKDVREVQLAKAAIRAGIELMCKKLGVRTQDIQKVYLAGAFGNYLDPASACAIGMIPPCLQERIEGVGNAAGVGAKACALNRRMFDYSKSLAEKAQFLELASMPQFNDCYVDCLLFEEE